MLLFGQVHLFKQLPFWEMGRAKFLHRERRIANRARNGMQQNNVDVRDVQHRCEILLRDVELLRMAREDVDVQ